MNARPIHTRESFRVAPGELEEVMDQGARSFGRWLARTMDDNGWSHPFLVGICKACTGDKAWLHSSQIASLRAARLKSPGPRSFLALEYLFKEIDKYQKGVKDELSPIWAPSQIPLIEKAVVMRDEDGNPATLGYLVEVFTGIRPVPIDLQTRKFDESQAKLISANAGRLLRRMMVENRMDIIDDKAALAKKYSELPEEQAELDEILTGQGTWDPETLDMSIQKFSKLLKRAFDFHRTSDEMTELLLKKS